ncbi:heterokaryon incompatibility [Colletotrichum sojae]|uniref:Heterokaryon incompatibility n=1 Tax=Colletotrichum sojae TaxID=2175907 RepID=A0A8H6ITC6_9PEZI|nr:heterokaryon incompatibility [Colletotrichum sojae]
MSCFLLLRTQRPSLKPCRTRPWSFRVRWLSTAPYTENLPEAGWFRLLRIEPSNRPSSPLVCRLETLPMRAAPPYEALSYAWGHRKASIPVTINGEPFLVRPNLHSALRALRRRDRDATLWVDAVCINQAEETERTHQVWQMKDIYRNATIVKVWLGDATEGSARGMRLLRRFNRPVLVKSLADYEKQYRQFLTLADNPKAFRDLKEALNILRRPWWTRMWTLQESVLGRDVRCICGTEEIHISRFSRFSRFVLLSVNFGAWRGPSLDAGVALRMARWVGSLRRTLMVEGSISLAHALGASWNRKSSDPKDKIMGLLGLVDWASGHVPEYRFAVEKIYRMAFFELLVSTGGMGYLGFMTEMPGERNPKLPTWVPDFEIHSSLGSDHLASLSKSTQTYNASLSTGEGLHATAEEDGKILVVEGIRFDSVQTVSVKAPGRELQQTDSAADSNAWMSAMRDTIDDWRSLSRAQNHPYPTGEDRARAFWRTVLIDLNQADVLKLSYALRARRNDEADLRWVASLESKEVLERLLRGWQTLGKRRYLQLRVIEQVNRRLFVTGRGYFGLGPPSLQAGDEVCVFRSGQVAYALRQSETGCWRYVGECYVHGIMDGEAVVEAKRNGAFCWDTFRIE